MTSISYLQEFKILRDIWQFAFIALYFVVNSISSSISKGLVFIPQILTFDFISNPVANWVIVLINFLSTIFLIYFGKYEPNDHFLLEARTWKNKGVIARNAVSIPKSKSLAC